ncbi:hypothetical protein [uncultured phage cr130_1]|uniref:Uncharacterized protein n=1 Tax=uncultured phage cr130_1 TaxID=2772092 RepID=A0A7M1RTB2_9CAUD|nr:hypothetical protein KNV59_gp28 [uncultured phage cr130_1]QOR57677.1 hypothetical protein [uncultured phage cr130_1]
MSDFRIRTTEVHLRRDKKSSMFVLTKIDNEGFSHTLFVSKRELGMIYKKIKSIIDAKLSIA